MHQQQTAFENIAGIGETARNEQFLLFPQSFLLNQIILSPFVRIFDISLFAAELQEPKICISGEGLKCCLQFVLIWTSLTFCCLVMGLKETTWYFVEIKVFFFFQRMSPWWVFMEYSTDMLGQTHPYLPQNTSIETLSTMGVWTKTLQKHLDLHLE